MLMVFQITCFSTAATMAGITQQHLFEIQFQPATDIDKRCIAFNDSESVATINYLEAGSVKAIMTNFHYFSDRNLTVQFLNISDVDFTAISLLRRVAYKVNISGQLEFPGSFKMIQNVQSNNSNCWASMTLEYDRTGENAYLSLKATPYFCSIPSPIVYFEFQIGKIWHAIQILPNSSSVDGFKLPYDHLSTKFYQVYRTGLIEPQKLIFDLFFTEFEKNRQIPIRMKMDYSQPGTDLLSQIISKISQFSTVDNVCLGHINFITIAGNTHISNIGALSGIENCVSGGVKILVQSVFQGRQLDRKEELLGFSRRQSVTFYYPERNDSVLLLGDDLQQFVFLLVYGRDGEVLHEEAYSFRVAISCLQKAVFMVDLGKSCAVVFPVQSERCDLEYGAGVVSSIEQIMQSGVETSSRVTYQSYLAKVQFRSSKFVKVCFSEVDVVSNSTFPYAPGDYHQRQKSYIKNFPKVTQKPVFITNKLDYQVLQHVTLTDYNKVVYVFIGVVFAVLIPTVTVMSLQIGNLQ